MLAKSGSEPAHVTRRGSAKKRSLTASPRRRVSAVVASRLSSFLSVIGPTAEIFPVEPILTVYGSMFPPVRPNANDGFRAAEPEAARANSRTIAPVIATSLIAPG